MKIERISIIRGNDSGSDLVELYTDLPGASYPFHLNASLKLTCAAGTGELYVRANFPDVEDVQIF